MMKRGDCESDGDGGQESQDGLSVASSLTLGREEQRAAVLLGTAANAWDPGWPVGRRRKGQTSGQRLSRVLAKAIISDKVTSNKFNFLSIRYSLSIQTGNRLHKEFIS